ncbi:hypothetical protein D3C76_1182980 [compost metagenome]
MGDTGDQRPLTGQVAAHPLADHLPVLEKEEHQDRHQYQVDHDIDQQRQARQRKRQRPLTELADLAPRHFNGLQHLLVGHQVRITLRQQQQQGLPLGKHAGQFVEQGDQLVPEQRHHDHDEHQQQPHEQREDQPHCDATRHPQALQAHHQTLHQVGQHHPGQHRRQHAAQGQHRGERQEQQDRQYHGFFVGEVALNPVAQHFEHQ